MLFRSLKKRDESHKLKIAYRSCSINLIFYIIITISGYISSFENTPDIILSRKVPEVFNIPVMIAQILISCGLCIGIPVNFFPLRIAICNQLFSDTEYAFKRAIIIAIVFSTSSCFLAIILPSISDVLSILGGLGCVIINFIIPMIAYINVLSSERKTQTKVSLFICSIIVSMGLGSTINAVYRMLKI